jgi:hypothetical protein
MGRQPKIQPSIHWLGASKDGLHMLGTRANCLGERPEVQAGRRHELAGQRLPGMGVVQPLGVSDSL